MTLLKNEQHNQVAGYAEEVKVEKAEDMPSESTNSLQQIYHKLYNEFVGGLKSERFTDSTQDGED